VTDHPSAEPRVSVGALIALEANARGLMEANPDLRTMPMRLHPNEFLGLLAMLRDARTELAALRPVVDAARKWHATGVCTKEESEACDDMARAVEAYESRKP